jgi:hypothetical protein
LEAHGLHGKRLELALERLAAGERFAVGNLILWLAPDGYLDIAVRSNWSPEYVTEKAALEELELAQELVEDLVRESPSFSRLVKGIPRRFVLYSEYDWHDTKEICRLVDNSLIWSQGSPK